MTPEQKQRAMQMLRRFSQTTPMTRTADNAAVAMAALLQDLVDAPEPEPVARVTGVYGGHTTVAPIDAAQVLRVGMALYTAPQAPSVPEVATATNPSQIGSSAEPFGYFKAEPFGWTDCAETDDGAIALFDAPPAPTPAEAPADVARDAELLRKLKHSIGQAKISGNDWRRELELMSSMIDAAMSEKGGA